MNLINEKSLIETALKLGNSQNFYGEEYLIPLRKLLNSLNTEAELNRKGSRQIFIRFLDILLKRASLAELVAAYPEIKEIPIEKPIFIIGLPRTGTTLLHNLMSQDSSNRTLKLWEMFQPINLTDLEKDFAPELIAKTELWLKSFARIQPEFTAMHPLHATAPDECNWLLQNTFAANIFNLYYYIPEYFRWLIQQDLAVPYQFYKLQLQAILWREQKANKPLQTRRLVLKSPDHLWHLDALLKVFPDAQIIHLHRDISECVPSFCSLCYAVQMAHSDQQTPEIIGSFCVEKLKIGVNNMLETRDQNPAHKFIDVSYRDLVKTPTEAISRIYQELEREINPQFMTAIENWLNENRQHKLGKHTYSFEQFGLDKKNIEEIFKDYSQRFSRFIEKA